MFVYYRKEYWKKEDPLRKWIKKGDFKQYWPTTIIFCCNEMKNHWNGAIGFGRLQYDSLNKVKDICIYFYERGWEGDYTWHSIPIKFCPFCMDKINLVEVK